MDKLLDFFDVFNVIDKAEGVVAGLLNFERSGRNCFLYRTPKGGLLHGQSQPVAGRKRHVDAGQ